MSQYFEVHPDNPQPRLLKQAAQILDAGGVCAVPTDSSYALVCHLDDKDAAQALRRIRQVDDKHHLTLLCRDLSELASYARVDNKQYRLLKHATPGPFTFILEATKEVPRRLSHPSRRTIGLRVPKHRVTQALLAILGQPLLATTLIAPGEHEPAGDPQAPAEGAAGRGRCRRVPGATDHGDRPHGRRTPGAATGPRRPGSTGPGGARHRLAPAHRP
jgi:tRNA threonylcarbamoyl adenosine modification protein (Sua5/YciO/YrdC/YwlC family)